MENLIELPKPKADGRLPEDRQFHIALLQLVREFYPEVRGVRAEYSDGVLNAVQML